MKLSAIILLFILSSCKTDYKPLEGSYKSADYNIFKKLGLVLSGSGHFINGNKLILEKDSSFISTSCSAIKTGIWYVKSDSIYLKVKTARWRNDSLQKYGRNGRWPKISDKAITYKITKTGFIRKVRLFNDDKSHISIDRLEKITCPNTAYTLHRPYRSS